MSTHEKFITIKCKNKIIDQKWEYKFPNGKIMILEMIANEMNYLSYDGQGLIGFNVKTNFPYKANGIIEQSWIHPFSKLSSDDLFGSGCRNTGEIIYDNGEVRKTLDQIDKIKTLDICDDHFAILLAKLFKYWA